MTHIRMYYHPFFLRVTRNPYEPLQFGISTVFLPYHITYSRRVQLQFAICTPFGKSKLKIDVQGIPTSFG